MIQVWTFGNTLSLRILGHFCEGPLPFQECNCVDSSARPCGLVTMIHTSSSRDSDSDEVLSILCTFCRLLILAFSPVLMVFMEWDAQGFLECVEEDVFFDEPVATDDRNPIPDCEGIDRDGWSGKALLARHIDGSDFAEVIIFTANLDACIDSQSRLGEDDVGIVVLEVYNGDPSLGDTCLRWPTRLLFYLGENGYVSVYDHARKRASIDRELEQNRKRRGKRQYRYEQRSRAAALLNKKTKLLSQESIADVFGQRCCDEECTQKFRPSTIRALCTELHLQTFQVKSTKILDVHRTMHEGLVTVEGINICPRAWRVVHSVPLRTFQRYKAKAKANIRGAPHGNLNARKTRTSSVQAIETLRSLLEASADHMPHLSRTLESGEKVRLKVLPTGTQWNQLLATVNEVRIAYLTAPHYHSIAKDV